MNGNTRTLAFQVSEELFERLKTYLTANKLTQKEYELIYHFCHHMNVIHERPALEDLLWPGNTNGNNYLNKCISSVRGILRRDDAIQIITYNRAGVMFCIKDSEETEEKQEGCLQE